MTMRIGLIIPLMLLAACSVAVPTDTAKKPSPAGPLPPVLLDEERVVCPADVKQCGDDSFVSRTGPRCEFAACPADKK